MGAGFDISMNEALLEKKREWCDPESEGRGQRWIVCVTFIRSAALDCKNNAKSALGRKSGT